MTARLELRDGRPEQLSLPPEPKCVETPFARQLNGLLDWQEMESMVGVFAADAPQAVGGSLAVLLKAAVLQHCYGLSDAQCSELLADRISWREFAGISNSDEVPTESAIGEFRKWLVEKGLHVRIFELCGRRLAEKGLELKLGRLTEAVFARNELPTAIPTGKDRQMLPEKATVDRSRRRKKIKLFFFAPFSAEGNLGKAYNEYMKLVPRDDDWVCFFDRDIMFLTPDYGSQIAEVIAGNPGIELFTCLTNRIGNRSQLYGERISDDPNILNHQEIAADVQQRHRCETGIIAAPVSGFLMVLQKRTWKAVKFSENLKLLHVDWDFSRRIAARGYRIGLMKGVYVFHYYRLKEGVENVSHLE